VERELDELGDLLEFSAAVTAEVLTRARDLLLLIESLEASGRCPESLHNDSRAFFFALGLHIARSPGAGAGEGPKTREEEAEEGGEGVGVTGGDDDDDEIHPCHVMERLISMGGSKGGSESRNPGLESVLETMGFRSPSLIVQKYGPRAVQTALNRLNSRPPGSVANRGAYLRVLLEEVQW